MERNWDVLLRLATSKLRWDAIGDTTGEDECRRLTHWYCQLSSQKWWDSLFLEADECVFMMKDLFLPCWKHSIFLFFLLMLSKSVEKHSLIPLFWSFSITSSRPIKSESHPLQSINREDRMHQGDVGPEEWVRPTRVDLLHQNSPSRRACAELRRASMAPLVLGLICPLFASFHVSPPAVHVLRLPHPSLSLL